MTRENVISSMRTLFLKELINLKQTLADNGFRKYIIDSQIKVLLSKLSKYNIVHRGNRSNINIFYLKIHENCKLYEFALRNINASLLLKKIKCQMNCLL